MRVKIEVTPSCIKRGKCNKPSECALALAINKYLGKRFVAHIGNNVYICDYETTENGTTVKLPLKALEFIRRFDTGKSTAKPISFCLNIPVKYLRSSVIKSYKIGK
jgi:hypothetical protein